MKEKYRKIPLPIKASLWLVICKIIQKGISFISTPIFTRLMSTDEFGVVSVFYSWESILTVFVTLQLSSGVYNKAMIKYEGEKDQYTSSMLALTSFITIGTYVIYVIGRKKFNQLLGLNTVFVTLLFVQIFFTSAFSFWSVRNRFDYKYRNVVSVTIITSVMGTLLSVMLLLTHSENRGFYRILGQVIAVICTYSVLFVVIMRRGITFIRRDYWNYSIKYNLPLIPHYLSQQILGQSDRIMINSMCGSSQAAYYAVAYQISMVINLLTSAMDYAFTPWAYRKIRDERYQELGKLVLQISGATGVLCFVFSLFAPEVVYVLGGEKYYSAVWVIPSVCMSVLFIMMYSLISIITFYYEKTRLIMMVSCIVAGLNVILNYIFVGMYGFVAAGYTTLFCYVLYFIIHYAIMEKTCKEVGCKNPFNTTILALYSTIFVILSLGCNFLYLNTHIRYGFIAFICMATLYIVKKYKMKILEEISKMQSKSTKDKHNGCL